MRSQGFVAKIANAARRLFGRRSERLDKYLYDHVTILRPDEGRTIGFSPRFPHGYGYQITKVCRALALHPVQGLDADLKMFWHDTTVVADSPEGAINWRVRDISKERVAREFERVFGYSLTVDPETHLGPCVEKLNDDGLHVGAVVECPLSRREGFVYQRIVDNREAGEVEDLRTVIVGSEIPLVYRKRRSVRDRFSNINRHVSLATAEDAFSGEEIRTILAFSREMGLDYGELDVLRDRADGRIYVVDVNKTTFGPPNHLAMSKRLEAIELIARSFERQFMSDW
jgi:hypothetical protein